MDQNNLSLFVDDELKIIHYKHTGLLKVEELGQAWQKLLELEEFTNLKYNLLSDYTEADFDFSVDKTDLIWEFLHSIKHILKGKKEAVITSKPVSTAISFLFESESNKLLNFDVRTFSTREAALEWLSH